MRSTLLISVFIIFSVHFDSYSQGETGLPFLLIHPSPEANGRGNTGTVVVTDNPFGTISNPAQLGLFSLHNYFSGSLYTPKTQWLPAFNIQDLTYNVWAMNAGYNLREELGLPFDVGLV